MQIASQLILSEPANSDADIRLREFAHRWRKRTGWKEPLFKNPPWWNT